MNEILKVWLVDGSIMVMAHKEFMKLVTASKVRYYEIVSAPEINIDSEL